ncbi:MAG: ABC transporter permease [Bacteroidota bacterium]|nr:ABC transporter permease [Bacteroidota bacterium]
MAEHISPFRESMRRLMRRKLVIISLCWLSLMVVIAVLAPVIANDKPFYFSIAGHHFFPSLSGDEDAVIVNEQGERSTVNFIDPGAEIRQNATIIQSPIRYAPHKSDLNNADYVSPSGEQFRNGGQPLEGSERHLLGTGRRGEDILAGMIHGSRVSMSVGILSMAIAGFIGLVLGAMAGYFGDDTLKLSRGSMLMTVIGILPAWFYGFQVRMITLEAALNSTALALIFHLLLSLLIFTSVLFLYNRAGRLLHFIAWFKKEIHVLADTIISRFIEILISLPKLILIISVAAISKPSLLNLILIIGFTSWTEIARFTRAEMLRVRSLDYIQSARSLGYPQMRIIFLHALPNAIAPALITISFGIAGAILMESALSFLGIGVPPDIATWGSLLAAGKENFSAWWLVVFPGVAIFLTVTAFNLVGEGLRDAFDPKLRK